MTTIDTQKTKSTTTTTHTLYTILLCTNFTIYTKPMQYVNKKISFISFSFFIFFFVCVIFVKLFLSECCVNMAVAKCQKRHFSFAFIDFLTFESIKCHKQHTIRLVGAYKQQKNSIHYYFICGKQKKKNEKRSLHIHPKDNFLLTTKSIKLLRE